VHRGANSQDRRSYKGTTRARTFRSDRYGLSVDPGRAPTGSDAGFWFSGHLLFRARQPRKLCVQPVDGFGSGFSQGRPWPRGGGRWRHEPAAGSVVATGGPAAVSAQAAQLLWGFIEKDIGVLVHGVFRTPHSLALVEGRSKSKTADGSGKDRDRLPGDLKPSIVWYRFYGADSSRDPKALHRDCDSLRRGEAEFEGKAPKFRICCHR
jgi:hypothetical protein